MKSKKTGRRCTLNFTNARNSARIAVIQHHLTEKPCTSRELVDLSGFSKCTTEYFVTYLKPRIHIAAWVKSGDRNWAPAYAWGPGESVPRPTVVKVKVEEIVDDTPPEPEEQRLARIRHAGPYRPQPVHRCAMQVMLFGEARA